MKKIYRFFLVLSIITLIYVSTIHFQFNLLISLVLLIIVYWIPHYLYKAEYLAYIYFTQILGSTVGFYNLPYYDKIMHFLSGSLFVLIGYILLKRFINQLPLLYIMINCVEATVAFLWEVFEYTGLVLFNYDASRHYTTGVHDTMQDMIFSFLAGIIMTYIIYKYPSYIDNLYKSQPDTHCAIVPQSHI